MNPDLKNRILNASITPLEKVWEKISDELDNALDKKIVGKLNNITIEPPVENWNFIEGTLNSKQPASEIPIRKKIVRLAVAASVIVAVVTISLIFLNNNESTQKSAKPQSNNANTFPEKNNQHANDILKTAENNNTTTFVHSTHQKPTPVATNKKNEIRYASTHMGEVNTIVTEKPEPVNFIDEEISSATNNYINPPDYFIVKAPNGQPVRISNKFSDAVNYLFSSSTDNNGDNNWKRKFDNWRNKLISNPSFIPAASNFLDIVELQELLKDQ